MTNSNNNAANAATLQQGIKTFSLCRFGIPATSAASCIQKLTAFTPLLHYFHIYSIWRDAAGAAIELRNCKPGNSHKDPLTKHDLSRVRKRAKIGRLEYVSGLAAVLLPGLLYFFDPTSSNGLSIGSSGNAAANPTLLRPDLLPMCYPHTSAKTQVTETTGTKLSLASGLKPDVRKRQIKNGSIVFNSYIGGSIPGGGVQN